MSKGILWLRNDLRVTDHPVLDHALKECNEVLFVYVFDDRVWRTQGENPRIRQYRARFLLQALEELKNKIEDLGGQIEFLFGRPSQEIPKLAIEYGASYCFTQPPQDDYAERTMIARWESGSRLEMESMLFHEWSIIGKLPYNPHNS